MRTGASRGVLALVVGLAASCDGESGSEATQAATEGTTTDGDDGDDDDADGDDDDDDGATTSPGAGTTGSADDDSGDGPSFDLPDTMQMCGCSDDGSAVVDCDGQVAMTCAGDEVCDPERLTCTLGCDYAAEVRGSDGCEFFPTYMDNARSALDDTFYGCFAVAVANTWREPVHIDASYAQVDLDPSTFGRLISEAGDGQLLPYDPNEGLPPGRVMLMFLSGIDGGPPDAAGCPVPSAVPAGVVMAHQTGVGNAFELHADAPVSVFQFNPYGGGEASITGASLLLPTAAWGTEYLAVNAHAAAAPPETIASMPSMNIIAQEDDTAVTITPSSSVAGGGPVPSGPAGAPFIVSLNRGEHLQLSQAVELTGSTVTSNKPVGFMAGHSCMFVPTPVLYCDHGEQMIPPAASLGHEYVGVMHRPRGNEPGVYRVVGAVDGTILTYSPDVGGPTMLSAGQVVEFNTAEPFAVSSQDADHPFVFFNYMSGNQWGVAGGDVGAQRRGDADVVVGVPTDQFQRQTTFMTDPTYPEANLVVVRKSTDGAMHDVELECYGVLDGWTSVGAYEWTRFDLTTGGVSAPGCAPGHQTMRSAGDFTVTVWGWGDLASGTGNVSYGFPSGMRIDEVNSVTLPPPAAEQRPRGSQRKPQKRRVGDDLEVVEVVGQLGPAGRCGDPAVAGVAEHRGQHERGCGRRDPAETGRHDEDRDAQRVYAVDQPGTLGPTQRDDERPHAGGAIGFEIAKVSGGRRRQRAQEEKHREHDELGSDFERAETHREPHEGAPTRGYVERLEVGDVLEALAGDQGHDVEHAADRKREDPQRSGDPRRQRDTDHHEAGDAHRGNHGSAGAREQGRALRRRVAVARRLVGESVEVVDRERGRKCCEGGVHGDGSAREYGRRRHHARGRRGDQQVDGHRRPQHGTYLHDEWSGAPKRCDAAGENSCSAPLAATGGLGYAPGPAPMSNERRSKLPLLLVMAGGIAFALGRRTLGLILSGLGALMFALRSKGTTTATDDP